ncbi:MAG: protein translocase subunit SecD, partial [Gammaproteobacteria bacterium]
MLNQYPLWKYIVLILALVLGTLYALPNLFGEDPSVQVSHRTKSLTQEDLLLIEQTLGDNKVTIKSS